MEILDLRHFSSSDLRPLLDEEAAIWVERLLWDYGSAAEMILRYIDAKILPGYAAVERGRVLGYCFFVYEGAKGVVGDLFVDPELGARAKEIETELVQSVIDTLQQSPGVHRIEAQLLIHEPGEMAGPFVEEGFARYARLFMIWPIGNAPRSSAPALPPEVEIRGWREQDYQPAAALITAAYHGHVDADINDQYRTVGGALRFLNNIVRFPGCGVFDPEGSFIAVHKPTKSNVGMILCSRVRNDVGHITQVCLRPEFRNHGIGEQLIETSWNSLRRRGFHQLTLTVTEANARAVALYKRLGFETKHVFDAFVWEG